MKLFARRTSYLRLSTPMDFNMRYNRGSGTVLWESLEQHTIYTTAELSMILAALHYARTLRNQPETQPELFTHVGNAASTMLSGAAQFDFEPWSVEVAGTEFHIWPWSITPLNTLIKPKTYVATLQESSTTTFGIHLRMAFGLERILVPSSVLLTIFSLMSELQVDERLKFCSFLLAVNSYCKKPNALGELLSDAKAVSFALPLLT